MAAATAPLPLAKERQALDSVTIRFSGDSGDGMQLTGSEFTRATAVAGNDLQTFPDYPAEIRAPSGTVAGVSGYQIQLSRFPVFTSGDRPDVLVAMNPAALKANLGELRPGGQLIINTGAFTPQNLEKAGYTQNPLEDGSLERYRTTQVDITRLNALALAGSGLSAKEVGRAKNMFALGLMLWMFDRPSGPTVKFLYDKFQKHPELARANEAALRAGYAYGESTEVVPSFQVPKANIAPGLYRNVSGNEAIALGLIAAARLSGLPGFLGSYPITPASDILHELSKHKNFGFTTFQAEDEIAAMASTVGAAYGGVFAATTTSGPGMALKQEAIGLAIMAELPLLIVNVQRGGPSTGLPTKTEQADLFQAVLGRNGESPLPVLAASCPSDCFDTVLEAAQIALTYMTPVVLLSDGYIANGHEPWRPPLAEELQPFPARFRTEKEGFSPFMRDPQTLARPWVRPGTPGLEHRLGGLEKDYDTGLVSYDGRNHERMVEVRAEKVARVARSYGPLQVQGEPSGDTLVVGWGSTYGAISEAVRRLRAKGRSISSLHLRHLNPLHPDLGSVLGAYKRVLVPELNLGQLRTLLRAQFLVDARGINKVQGKPFGIDELMQRIEEQA